MAFIELNDICFTYEAQEEQPAPAVLEHLNLSIEKGAFVAVLGHNGSGKSTIAKLMNGMLLPDSGQVLVDGMDTADEAHTFEIRRRVGMVFQNPDNQLVASIVEEDVAFGPENLGLPPGEIRRRVDDALRRVGMYEARMKAPHKLSGGQKQRVAVAGIIAMQPDCIVLDEPTAMLDPSGRKEVLATIRHLNREMGITVVLITHFMDEAVQADRVVVVDDGRILLDDAPRQVFRQVEQMKAVGLDVPQSTELLHRLRCAGYAVPDDCLNAAESAAAIAKILEA